MARWIRYPQQAFGDAATLGDPEVVKHEDYWQPWSEPVRQLPGVIFAAALIAASGLATIDPETLGDPEEPKVEHWWQPWSAPVLEPAGNHYYAALAASGTAPLDPETLGDPETVKLEDFWQPWSEPRWEPAGNAYAAALAASGGLDDEESLGEVVAAADTSTEWWQPWSEPVLPIPPDAALAAASGGLDEPEGIADPETVKVEHWWAPWSEPVLPVSSHAALEAASGGLDAPETISDPEAAKISHWWQPWSEPVQQLPGNFYTAAIAASGNAPIDPTEIGTGPEPTISGWWQPWSEPVLQPRGNAYAAAQSASGQAPTDPETIGDPELTERIEWFIPWQATVDRHPAPQPFDPVYVEHIVPVSADTSFEWFSSWLDPTLLPPRGELPTFFIDPEALNEEGVEEDVTTGSARARGRKAHKPLRKIILPDGEVVFATSDQIASIRAEYEARVAEEGQAKFEQRRKEKGRRRAKVRRVLAEIQVDEGPPIPIPSSYVPTPKVQAPDINEIIKKRLDQTEQDEEDAILLLVLLS